jgi:nitrogen fixation-related uncharacterized protein
MIAMAIDSLIGLIWLGFCAITSSIAIGFLVWAVRARQFGDQDHARYLPLESGDLEDKPEEPENPEGNKRE